MADPTPSPIGSAPTTTPPVTTASSPALTDTTPSHRVPTAPPLAAPAPPAPPSTAPTRRALLSLLSLDAHASTRAAALIRIGLPPLLWACLAEPWNLRRAAGLADAAEVVLFYAATLAMMAGLATRLATALVAAVLLHLHLSAATGGHLRFFAHHHQVLLTYVTCLMVLVPAGRSLSLDRWLAARRGPPPPERGPLWPQRLIALQVSAVYFWSAVDKLAPDYLSGARLERTLMDFYVGSDFFPSPALHALLIAASVLVLVLELALAVGLWSRRARRWLIPLGIALHAAFFLALPLCVFSALMVLLYLAFLDPAAVHRAIDRLLAPQGAP